MNDYDEYDEKIFTFNIREKRVTLHVRVYLENEYVLSTCQGFTSHRHLAGGWEWEWEVTTSTRLL